MKHLPFSTFRILIQFLFFCILFQQGFAQYYYNDIVLTARNRQQLELYKKNSIAQVKLLSYEANGQPAENFACEVTVSSRYDQVKTITRSDLTGNSALTAYYDTNGLLFRTTDSSNESVNRYQYKYDSASRLISAVSTSEGINSNLKMEEIHEWKYLNNGNPEMMLRIRNSADTSFVYFTCDSNGNVTEEEYRVKGIAKEKIYYYYDPENRLTDVVRYHPKLSRLLPDYMFEYDSEGKLIQMTIIQQGGSDYLLWNYSYAENGLITDARCLNKQKNPVGKIEYQYVRR